jgi:uncharacterized protein YgiM (DUF1202 family)
MEGKCEMAKRKLYTNNTPKELRSIPEVITPVKDQEPVVNKVTTVTVYNCSTLNVRKEPEKKDNILFVVPVGESLTLLKAGGPWSLVESASKGKSGWVMSEYIKKVE